MLVCREVEMREVIHKSGTPHFLDKSGCASDPGSDNGSSRVIPDRFRPVLKPMSYKRTRHRGQTGKCGTFCPVGPQFQANPPLPKTCGESAGRRLVLVPRIVVNTRLFFLPSLQ